MSVDFSKIIQIGFLSKNCEEAGRKYCELTGWPMPELGGTGPFEETGAMYHREPCRGRIRQCNVGDMGQPQMEFMEPIGEDASFWKEFLDREGEGFNHIAFEAKDIMTCIREFEAQGLPCLQYGFWPASENSGKGAYAYIDTRKLLGFVIELLEFDIQD